VIVKHLGVVEARVWADGRDMRALSPQSMGGSEATVQAVGVPKADLVPTDHNLRAGYERFAELETACPGSASASTPASTR